MGSKGFDFDQSGELDVFDQARQTVAAGVNPAVAAAQVVAAMTNEELLWCLDGDAPMWAGRDFFSKGGYHDAPFAAATVAGGHLVVRNHDVSRNPRRCTEAKNTIQRCRTD